MNIGSTPRNTFVIPDDIDITGYKEIQIVYNQHNKAVVIKNSLEGDIEVNGNELSVVLSQADTFKFDWQTVVRIQVRIMLSDDSVIASTPITVDANQCMDDNVLTGA